MDDEEVMAPVIDYLEERPYMVTLSRLAQRLELNYRTMCTWVGSALPDASDEGNVWDPREFEKWFYDGGLEILATRVRRHRA